MTALSWLEPRVQPTWNATRLLWALAGLATWVPRGAFIEEAYSGAGIVVPSAFVALDPLSLPAAWAHYVVLIAGLLLVGLGRRNRLGTLLFLGSSSLLLLHEGLNLKAYDRLLFWQGLVLLAAPSGGRGDRQGSPFAQHWMTLLYIGLYGSNGWFKVLAGSDWWNGTALAYTLVDPSFGGMPLGVWVSDKSWLTAPLAWWTLLFETGFVLLIWLPRARPWLLLAGFLLHVGIALSMRLNTFELVVLSGYPVLLGDRAWVALLTRARRFLPRARVDLSHLHAVGSQARTASSRALDAVLPHALSVCIAGTLLFVLDRAVLAAGTSTLDATALVTLWSMHVASVFVLALGEAAWAALVRAYAHLSRSRAKPMVAGVLLAALGAAPLYAVSAELTSGAWIARQSYAPLLTYGLVACGAIVLACLGGLRSQLGALLLPPAPAIVRTTGRWAAALFGLAATIAAVIDAQLLVGLYPALHRLLYAASALLVLFAASTLIELCTEARPSTRRWMGLAGLATFLCALASLTLLIGASRGALEAGSRQAALVLPLVAGESDGTVVEALTQMRVVPRSAPGKPGHPAAGTSLLDARHDYNVLLVLADTLRADALPPRRDAGRSFSGADTPFLNRWLMSAFRFRNVYSQASCTRPSLLPTFRSLDTRDEAAVLGVPLGVQAARLGMLPIAIVPPYIKSDAQELLQGFERVFVYEKDHQQAVVERARDVFAGLAGRRFFAWVHFYALHAPYFAGTPTTRSDGSTKDRYKMALRWLDGEIEQLIAALEAAGLADRTIIVLAADHGENLGENGKRGHGGGVSELELRVPLAVHIPGRAGGVIDTFVGNVDIVPTLLDIAGAPTDDVHRGRSLLPIIAGVEKLSVPHYFESSKGDSQGVAIGSDKLVRSPSGAFHRYDTAVDPTESRDLYAHDGRLEHTLRRALLQKNPVLFANELARAPAHALLLRRLGDVAPETQAGPDLALLFRLAALSGNVDALASVKRISKRARDPEVRALAARCLRP